ncbi:hypothetical protein TEA_028824 [Camellia sinensis var. sinensis]|uniref:Uncharacterized protein n=1 Tax=Camellia sinensis var. sinensis TaxID=542762 RepID=A0A4S4E4Y9_CAMSN|nr:hypothetical protein TEA_028824 [Camellia sinensis var. sinensis]
MSSQLLRLNAFWGELANPGFEWHFILNHNSSADSSTSIVGSLNQVTAYESPAHSSTSMRSEPRAPPTAWELTVSCSISLPDGGSFHPSLTVVFCLPMDSAVVRKVDLFRNLGIYAYFQLLEAFRRLLRPSWSMGA